MRTTTVAWWIAGGLLFAGCKGVPTPEESVARQEVAAVASVYRPEGQRPHLPELSAHSTLTDFLRYAMLSQPQIEAAYFNWLASVERITTERSLPDPRLTFESDIADIVKTVMPGLMQELPGPGKLRARANIASAGSQTRYFAFETAVLQTAFALKRAYYNLWFLDEKIRISQETLVLLGDLERSARAQSEVGKSTLQDVYRAQIEQDRLNTEIANLVDSRNPLRAQFKAALGLAHDQHDPPFPARFESTPLDLKNDGLLEIAFARNPRLKAMEAEVRMAQASLELAYKAGVPDFTLGVMTDARAVPIMARPQASMTLPIWRDKIAAEIAATQAGKRAAEARLTNEQIMLTVDFAEKTYIYRETTRNITMLEEQLIPKARQLLKVARAGYLSARTDFLNLIDAERTLLNFQLSNTEERTRREITLAEISLLIQGVAPAGAPISTAPRQAPLAPAPPMKKE